MIEQDSTEIVSARDVSNQTAKDLAKVLSRTLRGWPSFISRDNQAYPYFMRSNEITSLKECLPCGSRIIISPPGRQAILYALHAGHLRIVKMKGLERSCVWWPKLDSQIRKHN